MKKKLKIIVDCSILIPILFLVTLLVLLGAEFFVWKTLNLSDELNRSEYGMLPTVAVQTFVISIYIVPILFLDVVITAYNEKHFKKIHFMKLLIIALYAAVFLNVLNLSAWLLG